MQYNIKFQFTRAHSIIYSSSI